MCDVNAKCSNQYIQSEQRKYHQETTRTEAWENTSSESQLVSVLHQPWLVEKVAGQITRPSKAKPVQSQFTSGIKQNLSLLGQNVISSQTYPPQEPWTCCTSSLSLEGA